MATSTALSFTLLPQWVRFDGGSLPDGRLGWNYLENRSSSCKVVRVRHRDPRSDGDGNAARLLKHILVAIQGVFPHADLSGEPDECNNIVLSVGADCRIKITERFLEADDGLTSAIYSLGSLAAHLRRLESGDTLLVTHHGLRLIPNNDT